MATTESNGTVKGWRVSDSTERGTALGPTFPGPNNAPDTGGCYTCRFASDAHKSFTGNQKRRSFIDYLSRQNGSSSDPTSLSRPAHYQLLSSSRYINGDIRSQVMRAIAEGWEPLGAPSVTHIGGETESWHQAMVRR